MSARLLSRCAVALPCAVGFGFALIVGRHLLSPFSGPPILKATRRRKKRRSNRAALSIMLLRIILDATTNDFAAVALRARIARAGRAGGECNALAKDQQSEGRGNYLRHQVAPFLVVMPAAFYRRAVLSDAKKKAKLRSPSPQDAATDAAIAAKAAYGGWRKLR